MIATIPSNYYKPANKLTEAQGIDYSLLKSAAQQGGVLVRWRSPKTRRVFYKSKNLSLL